MKWLILCSYFFYICCIYLVILNLMTTSWKRGVKPMTPAPIKLDQRASTVHIIVVNYASTRNIYVIVHWKREGLHSWKPFECRMTFHSWDNLLILIIADYFSTFTKFLFGAQHSCFRKKKIFGCVYSIIGYLQTLCIPRIILYSNK